MKNTKKNMQELTRLILPEIRKDLEKERLDALRRKTKKLYPSDLADIIRQLEKEEVKILLEVLKPGELAKSLEQLEDHEQRDVIRLSDIEKAANVLDRMAADERVDVIKQFDESIRRKLLDRLPASTREDIQDLARYPEETAGSIMTSDFAYLPRGVTVEEAIKRVRKFAQEPEELYYLYLVDERETLTGIVTMRDLLTAPSDLELKEISNTDIISVKATVDQEEVARLLQKYDFLALPVIDEEERLIGIVTADDLMDVAEEEASEDFQRLGGSEPLERPYFDMSIVRISQKRVGWLLLLFFGGMLTTSVMGAYEEELTIVPVLSFFIPLLIGTGGNAGAQTVSTIIRALALDEVQLEDLFHVILREFATGLLMGTVLAIIGFLFARGIWTSSNRLALVVACAFPMICMWANVVAGVVPILADKVGIDPTVISAPLITTLVDATGLIIYFTLASWILDI